MASEPSSKQRQVELIRLPTRKGFPTFGVLMLEDLPQILTLELPFKDNKRNESCIPEGRYICDRFNSAKVSGQTFLITEVPGRSGILFHHGNTAKDTEGCIIVGSEFGFIDGQYGVVGSKKAFLRFMDLFNGINSFALLIRKA